MSKSKVTTESVLEDFTARIVTIYLVIMFLVYPLYMVDGLYYIGTYKFYLYRIVTGTAVLFSLFPSLYFWYQKYSDRKLGIIESEKFFTKEKLLSPEFFICLSVVCCFISFVFSINKFLALWGFSGFHAGLFLEAAMAATFFMVLGYYKDSWIIWGAAFAGSAVVNALSVLNRFSVFPVDTGVVDPEYISTIGQTNWVCAYMICFTAAGIGFFALKEFDEKYRTIIYVALGVYNALAFAAFWVVGSDSALLVSAIIFFVILGYAIKDRASFIKYLISLLTFFVVPEVLYVFMYQIFPGKFFYFQEEDTVNKLIKSHLSGCVAVLVLLVLLFEIFRNRKAAKWPVDILKKVYKVLVVLSLLGAVGLVVLIVRVTTAPESMGKLADVSLLRFTDNWGSFRGLTWRISVKTFAGMPFLRKLVGVGSGCFQEYTYSISENVAIYDTYVFDEVMPNAHNDYLTVLIENGILGFVAILGVFISLGRSLYRRAAKHPYAVIALASLLAYTINLFVSFKTVVSTPYIFIFAAMALKVSKDETFG